MEGTAGEQKNAGNRSKPRPFQVQGSGGRASPPTTNPQPASLGAGASRKRMLCGVWAVIRHLAWDNNLLLSGAAYMAWLGSAQRNSILE